MTNKMSLCIILGVKVFIFSYMRMKLPEQYKNLAIEQKRIVVANLIAQYWDDWIQNLADNIADEQVEFLFTYFFTESREERERMWQDMQKKYEATLKEVEYIAERIQMLNIQYKEFLASRKDVETFLKK